MAAESVKGYLAQLQARQPSSAQAAAAAAKATAALLTAC
jgi:hypothetical protein